MRTERDRKVRGSLAKLAIASPLLMFLETIMLHIILFQVTSETVSRSLIRGWRCSAFSGARRGSIGLYTQTGQCPARRSDRTRCGNQKQVQLAMEVVGRKMPGTESENDASKDWAGEREKTWRLEQTKRGPLRCKRHAGALEWTSPVDIVNVQSLFSKFSFAVHFFYFQNKVVHGEIGTFAWRYVVGLQTWRLGCLC